MLHAPIVMHRRSGLSALLLVIGILGLVAPVSADDVYRLGVGDRLKISVFGEEALSGEFQIDGTGSVSLPLVGELELGGTTVREAERRVEGALANGYLVNPRVSVEVTNYRPFYILGEVRSPGSYPYRNGMTVINAVAVAGGFTYRARRGRALIQRDGELRKDAEPSTLVLPGDIITIPERFF